jgi:hypothetical protein
MSEYRSIEGELKILQRDGDFIFPVELWLLNDQLTRNGWRFTNLSEHREKWAGVPILTAYVNGGNTVGDGHNQQTKLDKNGDEYQSFTASTAERIVGAISDNPEDVRIEERDGTQWVVGKGFLWAWYSHELVLQIADDAEQGRSMSVSIEALVTEGYMDGDVEIETAYVPLGVTVLGHGVAPAVDDAHIAMLSEIGSELKELKLRAASYIEQENAEKSQNNSDNKGVNYRMRLTKAQLRELQPRFADHTVLAAEQGENGIVVCLMSKAGQAAVYVMGSLDADIVPERIVEMNAQTHFCAEGFDDVTVDACDMVEVMCATASDAVARADKAEKDLAAANETIEAMRTDENARRLSAAKKKATDTLDAFNANRDSKIDVKALEALNQEIDAGKFTALTDDAGAWAGEAAVEEKVLSLCAAAVMEQDKKAKESAAKPMTWGSNFKQASAAPGTVGELFASKN